MTTHLFRLLAFSASISFFPVLQFQSLCAESREDSYLTPTDEDRETREPEASYKKAVEQKLFLTPGEIARVVRLPGTVGLETVVAVYRRQPPKKAEYAVTVTQPSKSLWDPENKSEETAFQTTTILRLDAGLPKTTALVIQKVWKAMLLDVREPPESNKILLESSTQIFSTVGPNGKLLRGQLEGLGAGKTAALSNLVDLLVEYCDTPETGRVEIAHRIEKAASALLERIASSNSNKRHNAKSASASNAALMAPQQDTLQPVTGGTSESARTLALVSSATGPRVGSSINDFVSTWGPPSDEETLGRTANLKWKDLTASGESIMPGIFAIEVAFLDRIACQIVLRSAQRITRQKLAEVAQSFLPAFRNDDFAKPLNDSRTYKLSDGTLVWANKHNGHTVIVIKGPDYTRNEDVFDREAATVRPPTSNH